MHDSSRALLKRGSIAAATTALVIGSSFAAPAIATTTASPVPVSTETSAAPTTEASRGDSKADLPAGLEEAVTRDLGKSLEEFNENGKLNALVETLAKELKQSKLDAEFVIADEKINVRVSASALEAVTKKLDELTQGIDVELKIAAEPEIVPSADSDGVEISESPVPKIVEPEAKDLDAAESPKNVETLRPSAPSLKAKGTPKSVNALLDEYVKNVEPDAVSELQAIMKTNNGFVIRTGGAAQVEKRGTALPNPGDALPAEPSDELKLTPAEFASQYTKVTVEIADGPAEPAATNDVLGGMGYGAVVGQGVALCSIGFSGFDPEGAPAVISAGHCEQDGDISKVKIIEHDGPNNPTALGDDLGTFGFSQFGGPGNSAVTTDKYDGKNLDTLGNVGTDISVIDGINEKLNLKALVTDWKGADERDSGTKVTGVASAVVGADICKSGRTTGWTCGTVDAAGIVFVVGGFNGTNDIRGVRGFSIANPYSMIDDPDNPGTKIPKFEKADRGDSGGSAISGGTAVGITSAVSTSDKGYAYFTDIKDGLKHTRGYSIALFLNAPAVSTPARGSDISAGQTINGTVASAPAGSTVKIKSAGQKDISAKVANGKFSFKAPAKFGKFGKFDFTLQTINGHNESTITAGSFNVVIGAPAITTPKNDATLNAPVSTISGTGVVGATVTLTGDATGTATVAADGTWSIKLAEALLYGEHSISATQARDGQTSKAATSAFKIQLDAPAITTPANGKTYTEARKVIAGTGVAGAEVKLTLPDAGQASAAATQLVTVGNDGKWSFTLEDDAALSYGSHSVTAVQSVGETTSAAAKSNFKVVPVAPSIASPTDGQKFAFNKAPKTVSGFGVNGATIKVTIGDTELTATVADGAWTVLVPADLKPGNHKVTAVQVIDEVASASTSISFTLAAEPKPEPSEAPTSSPKPSQDPEPSKAPVAPQGNSNDDDNDSDPLANTGPNAALPFIATGGVLLVAGGAFMLFRRKNTNGHHGA
ncbi:Ig-like domain-containing protein [Arthrobacter sp. AQ5-05]|uniref:Ig-like domain-containing protein n=1 Tax=Arthrobacter sp. AQ5-05 TaxID=2184581 RepID=UPI0015EC4677|nr:Ig-like domain-containing protein [Arthrobacter sp. AQ5-05]